MRKICRIQYVSNLFTQEVNIFWFKKAAKPVISLEQHLPAAKKYINQCLYLAKLIEAMREEDEEKDVQYSIKKRNVQYSLKTSSAPSTSSALRKDYLTWETAQRSRETFSCKVLAWLNKKGIDPRTFYRQAGMDRKLFSKLKTDFCYQPKKETAIRCCLALELSDEEAIDLLKSAGYALSNSSSFDLAIRYCLKNHIYALEAVNMLLEALEEKILE